MAEFFGFRVTLVKLVVDGFRISLSGFLAIETMGMFQGMALMEAFS